jgi:hypothetical protein
MVPLQTRKGKPLMRAISDKLAVLLSGDVPVVATDEPEKSHDHRRDAVR